MIQVDFAGIIQAIIIIVVVLVLTRPVGRYLVTVYFKERSRFDALFGPLERALFRILGVNPTENMSVKRYIFNLLLLNGLMAGVVLVILLNQASLPLNPNGAPNMAIDQAFNTASSFITNTNWQSYAGETQLSYFSQMACITFLMFTSAATGLAAGAAFIRGFASRDKRPGFRQISGMGNFYFDFVRSITRVLIPLAFIVSLILVAQGVPQTLSGPQDYVTMEGVSATLYRGPVASLESIKHLGTNGGGFYGQNSAFPYENPTPVTNVVENVSMLVLPISLIYAFGVLVGNSREAWVLIGALLLIFVVMLSVGLAAESSNQALSNFAVNQSSGNLEGKEIRFGVGGSVMFTVTTTSTGTGSVNSMLDSYTAIGGLVPLSLLLLSGLFAGEGSGLLRILINVILAVFIAGLMVGRTPQYLGRKIESKEVKLTLLAFLVHPVLILTFTAAGVVFAASSMGNPGFHGFTEMLYAYATAAANNGSAFAGLQANTPFLNYTLGLTMLLGRYIIFALMLLVSNSFMQKKITPYDVGTFRTDKWIFGLILIGVIVILGALTFFPVLVLGPLAEALI
ncbi:MAG: potassium-transporting ATPase subunit KdpA [Halobacteriota archaeon]